MAYADQKMSAGRFWSIVIVAVLHAILGYAFVTGLAFNVIKKAAEDLKTFDVTEEPPPPEEEPPPPQEVPKVQPPPVVAPPPIVRVNTPTPQIVQTVRVAPPPVVTPTAPPAPPPAPPAPPKVEPARAKGDLRSLFSADDYPPSALRNNEEGTVRVSLTVGPNGRVSACNVTQSSGSSALDAATCRIIRSRARFTPARDTSGNPVSDSQSAPPIRWQVPAE